MAYIFGRFSGRAASRADRMLGKGWTFMPLSTAFRVSKQRRSKHAKCLGGENLGTTGSLIPGVVSCNVPIWI